MAFLENHQDCDFTGVRQFLNECYVLADDTNLDLIESKIFDLLIQYKIPISARFYYRRLTNLKERGDFVAICSVWDQVDSLLFTYFFPHIPFSYLRHSLLSLPSFLSPPLPFILTSWLLSTFAFDDFSFLFLYLLFFFLDSTSVFYVF